jgi:hypothetical protein
MAGNEFNTNDDIFVDFDYQNIVLVDPNKTVRLDGTVQERQIHHENLVMYANLEAKMLPRTKLAVGQSLLDPIQTTPIASINFLRPGGKTTLTNSYIDEITGLNSISGKGTNQPGKNIRSESKPDDFYITQNTLNRQDTGLLGIESIRVKNTRSMTPTVEITLIDTQGRALFEKGENSEYASFFNLPYPTFYLTLKGYYGKAIRYQLILTKFSAAFEGNTGNYRISLTFYSYKYTILAESQVGSLFATPYMYPTDFRVNSTAPQSGQVNASLSSIGNTSTQTQSIRTTKGYQTIRDVYKKYKAEGLISPDLPELSFPELRARLEALEKNLQISFGQADFTPLSDVETYFKLLTKLRDDITGPDGWFSKYVDPNKQFVLNSSLVDGQQNVITYIYNEKTIKDPQLRTDAYNQLKELIVSYTTDLKKNKTLGLGGNFTVENVKYDSEIKDINKINIKNSPPNSIDPDVVRKAIDSKEINWRETFILRNKREPVGGEENLLAIQESTFFIAIESTNSEGSLVLPTYNFVFEGKNNFSGIIDTVFGEISQKKELIVTKLSEFLSKKIEGDDGLGFKPTLRNIMAMIFASVEAFYRLMDDVHSQAWAQRLNPIRKRAVYDDTKTSVSSDSKDLVQRTSNNGLAGIPVYPWPQYFVETNSENGEQFELRYPGDPKEISRTRANNFEVWPEVQFVEEYIRGLAQRANIETGPSGSQNEQRTIKRLSVNSVDFPMTNVPYSDYDSVKYLYEIYERILISAYYDRILKTNSKQFSVLNTISDIETTNILESLNTTSPFLVNFLKNTVLNSASYLTILRQTSNDGTGPSWQEFIRGIFTSSYLRGITNQDFSILDNSLIQPQSISTSLKVDSLTKLEEYVKSTQSSENDVTDLYPFISETWSQNNLANYVSSADRYETTKSLFVNTEKRFITNYQSPESQNDNRPFINGSFLSAGLSETQTTSLTNQQFGDFYRQRRENFGLNYFITEGPVNYVNAEFDSVSNLQTTSMLNTPIFMNAFHEGVQLDRNNGDQYPYVKASYLLLNSLPLSTLREKYKTITSPKSNIAEQDLDYIFASLTKFGGVHKLPYAWILKYGSIWHRYKKYIETGVDLLDSVWTNLPANNYYNPTNGLSNQYTFTSKTNTEYSVYGQINVSNTNGSQTVMNMGFYPVLINDTYFFVTGQDLLTSYDSSNIQSAIDDGLVIGTIPNASIQQDVLFDTKNPTRTLNYNSWFTTFNTGNSPKFKESLNQKTLVLPSFGTEYNQVKQECFIGNTLQLEVSGNTSLYNGSARMFWSAPNYGYFELSSVTKPNYNEYFKEVYSNNNAQEPFKFGQTYSKIEDMFGVFKTEILDAFENEFLNFSKSFNDISSENITDNTFVNRNFQSLLTNALTINQVDGSENGDNYTKDVSEKQMNNLTTILKQFINYDVVFRFGNPSNFNRKLFVTFTTDAQYNIYDKYVWEPYIQNTLPTSGGTITQNQSELINPDAWKTMYTYVGFASQSGLTYSNSGSYYTDFFVDANMEFTSVNIITFAPIIKMYGTQKLLNNGNYTFGDFKTSVNEYYTQNETSLNEVLNLVTSNLNKRLQSYTVVADKPILSAIDGAQPKIELYEAFKSFNDKWIAGGEFRDRTLFQDVLFLDRANRDIGDKVYVDVFKLKDFFSGSTSMDTRIIDFVSRIIADNKFIMMPLPAYMNFWGVGDVKQGVPPNAEKSSELANSLFGTFLDVDYRDSQPKLVCFYAGKPSEHLDMRENADYRWRTDAFDLTRISDMPLVDKLQNKTDWAQSNKVVGFNVDFGTRNQGMFYSIQLDQNTAAATTEANMVVTNMANRAGGRPTTNQNVSLYNLYKNRSYECRVESMGNMMIQPTMYFNLRYVPMFRGPYMIQSVEHTIDGGQFRTFFTGVRMPVYSLPLIEQQLISINQNLLTELVQSVRRTKETESTAAQPAVNTITIGNSILTNVKYTPGFQSECFADIQNANINYQRFTGVENTQQSITFSDLCSLIGQNATTNPLRAIIFFMAYINGHDDNKVYSFNNDLGGTPLGGLPFPQISYGGRDVYFKKEYACKSNQNGTALPYAIFESYENSIKFIRDYFSPNGSTNTGILFSDPAYTWDTKEKYIGAMVEIYLRYWPQGRTKEEVERWSKNNKTSVEKIIKYAERAIEISIQNKLINIS